jgi:hypothetical protein
MTFAYGKVDGAEAALTAPFWKNIAVLLLTQAYGLKHAEDSGLCYFYESRARLERLGNNRPIVVVVVGSCHGWVWSEGGSIAASKRHLEYGPGSKNQIKSTSNDNFSKEMS